MEARKNPRGRPRVDPDLIALALELVEWGVRPETVSDHLRIGKETIYIRWRALMGHMADRRYWVSGRRR